MYYYAYLDANDICVQIYTMPAPITGDQFIAISSNDQTLVGQRFNRTTSEFETVYYYAVLDDRSIVESVTFSTTQQTTSATLLSVTFAQYQTVTGMYWNGTEFVEPPISLIAVASTDEVNYKAQDKWLSTKLDEMDAATAENASDISEIATNMATIANSLSTLATAVDGKANASHTHTAADLSGVVKSVNGTAPDANGNVSITVSGGSMAAADILAALKTVDGTGSGLDADLLDGMDSTAFALAAHSHTDYLTEDDLDGYATTEAMTTALASKADANHNHNDLYAPVSHTHDYAATNHTHDGYATSTALTSLQNDVDGKAEAQHDHSISDVSGLQSALNGKSDTDHTHSGYAETNHTHSDYLPTSGGTVSGNLNVTGILRVNGQQCIYDSGSMVTLSTNNRQTMIAGSAIYSKVAISVSSDERLKENIEPAPLDKLAELVQNLNVYTYNYIGSDEENVGVIAQELAECSPDLEKYYIRTGEDGYLSVKTTDLVFALVAAVQALQQRVSELETK